LYLKKAVVIVAVPKPSALPSTKPLNAASIKNHKCP
jgi:hypothetical protein